MNKEIYQKVYLQLPCCFTIEHSMMDLHLTASHSIWHSLEDTSYMHFGAVFKCVGAVLLPPKLYDERSFYRKHNRKIEYLLKIPEEQ